VKIGVFDSGIGGLSVAQAIRLALPHDKVLFINDTKNVPYGTKSPAELLPLVIPLLQQLVDDGCHVIVVACNTVSTTLIIELRQHFAVPLIAMEPMIKPAAAQSKTRVIAVCATPTTLASMRYAWLKATYAARVTVLEPDCRDWSAMIEHKQIDHKQIRVRIEEVLALQADVIVLGCTHYHWIEDYINNIVAGRAVILQPEQPVIAELKRVLARLS
jgi:glutamate racemase